MYPDKIFAKFRTMFPQYYEESTDWFPNGRGSVRIRLFNHEELIFTYISDTEWLLETKKVFLDNLYKKIDKK